MSKSFYFTCLVSKYVLSLSYQNQITLKTITMTTIYLNLKSSTGVETVDEFTQEPNQTWREFRKYVSNMVSEYQLAGMNVYRSSRCTKDWKN